MKREKVFKFQSAINENRNEAWNNFKAIRNINKVRIEQEKNRHITNKINAYNQREMWCKIKELVLRKPKNVIKTVIHENIEYKEDTKMATIFNKYFVNRTSVHWWCAIWKSNICNNVV